VILDSLNKSQRTETIEVLDKIYFCRECHAVFLFKSDTEDHDLFMGHTKFDAVPFGEPIAP
jgi:hypothetical protein